MSSIEEVKTLQIPLQELFDATDGFSAQNLLARGGFGKVYKGVSVKDGNIAIKILDPWQGQGDHEFRTEIALLSVYKHENIVSLLGFSDEDGQKIIVYKYESNGSLDKQLNNTDLTWIQRLHIFLDAARGLQYLHDDVEPHCRILHRDVKSSNILLDENWRAKISDFGLSRISPANIESTFLISNPCGTFGYIDPEYMTTGYLTQKSDVYSFGVVLFEVLCGRLARVAAYKDKRQFLTNLIKIHWREKNIGEIIFPDLQRQMTKASLLTFSSIAYQCLMSGNERPTMKEVVEQLQKALDFQLEQTERTDDRSFVDHHQEHSGDDNNERESPDRIHQPRFQFIVKSVTDDILGDEWRWKKHGQKLVANGQSIRSYYLCANSECTAMKHVERSSADPTSVITTYEGVHCHEPEGLISNEQPRLT